MSEVQTGEVDVDSLLERIEGESADGGGIPMEQPAEAPAPAPAPTLQEVEFTHGGKQIKAPWDRAKEWASRGYDYSQKMAAFQNERTQFETERKSHQEMIDRFKQVDEYVKQNPQWWDHVNAQYQAAQGQVNRAEAAQGGGELPANHPLMQKLAALESQVSEVSQFKQTFEAEKHQQQREQEDKALTEDIQSLRKEHAKLDWDTPDANGQSLELRVMKHAIEHDIKNFKTAFRDMMHEELVKRAEERGKESIAKDRQKQTKLGLLGASPTPRKSFSDPKNIKEQSYEDLAREAIDELRQA